MSVLVAGFNLPGLNQSSESRPCKGSYELYESD